jgi:uncharacterized protein (DUF486 family)
MAFHDWISTLGVSLILLAFVLVTFRWSTPDKPITLTLNLVGAALACWGAALIESYPFVVLEATWALVAGLGLLQRLFRKAKAG